MKPGRPPFDREPLMAAIRALPRAGMRLRQVRGRSLAKELGCDRGTVASMLQDLEAAGRIRQRRSKGHCGMLVEILD